MSDPNKFPAWIFEAIRKNQNELSPKSKEFFEKLIELFPHFDRAFLSIPATSDIGILKNFDLDEIQRHYGFESTHEFIL